MRFLNPTSNTLRYAVAGIIAVCTSAVAGSQTSAPTGSVVGVVTASGPNARTIKAAHVLVQIWRADDATSAVRDSACNAWLADKDAWVQANEEIESPSGMNLAGTHAGQDVQILHSLYALRRDTVRSGDDGTYTFTGVPPGAYTVVADTYAGDKFLQWNADVGVVPKFTTRADLGADIVAENQYCALTNADSAAGKIYDLKELDVPIQALAPYGVGSQDYPVVHNGRLEVTFVVNEDGIPDVATVTVKSSNSSFTLDDARDFVRKMRFTLPTVHGRPVKARSGFVVQSMMQLRPR